MISSQILQNTIEGLKTITRVDLCVMDTDGKSLATTFPEAMEFTEAVQGFVNSPADSQVINGCQFFKVFDASFSWSVRKAYYTVILEGYTFNFNEDFVCLCFNINIKS